MLICIREICMCTLTRVNSHCLDARNYQSAFLRFEYQVRFYHSWQFNANHVKHVRACLCARIKVLSGEFDDPVARCGTRTFAQDYLKIYIPGSAARNLKTCQLHFADKLCQQIFPLKAALHPHCYPFAAPFTLLEPLSAPPSPT